MEIIQTTSISLTDEEKRAIHTLNEAFNECVCNECYECEECPIYVHEECLGQLCAYIIDKEK